jgi:hypothetical protein
MPAVNAFVASQSAHLGAATLAIGLAVGALVFVGLVLLGRWSDARDYPVDER